MRTSIAALLAGSFLATLVAGCAGTNDLGPEFVEIKAEDTQLAFTHPSMAGSSPHFFKGRNRSDGAIMYTGSWRAARSEFPVLELALLNAPSGYYLPSDANGEDLAAKWGVFKNRKVTYEDGFTIVNGLGRIAARSLHADTLACVAFAELFGFNDYGAGSRRLDGFYCTGPGTVLSKDNMIGILQAISVRTT